MEHFELAMVADHRLHEPHIVTHLEEMTSISLEPHLRGFVTVALESRSKIVDKSAANEIPYNKVLTVGI
jgi:hypothetical protein